jgi:hypothetical protein
VDVVPQVATTLSCLFMFPLNAAMMKGAKQMGN